MEENKNLELDSAQTQQEEKSSNSFTLPSSLIGNGSFYKSLPVWDWGTYI